MFKLNENQVKSIYNWVLVENYFVKQKQDKVLLVTHKEGFYAWVPIKLDGSFLKNWEWCKIE